MNLMVLKAIIALAPLVPELVKDVEAEMAIVEGGGTFTAKAQDSLNLLTTVIKLVEGLL